jgi:hypothetical protein
MGKGGRGCRVETFSWISLWEGRKGRWGGILRLFSFFFAENHWEQCIWSPFFLIISMEGMAMVLARWRTAAGVGEGTGGWGMGLLFVLLFLSSTAITGDKFQNLLFGTFLPFLVGGVGQKWPS